MIQQYHNQVQYHRTRYPGSAFDLILADGVPCGRLSIYRSNDEIRVVEIALMPQYRGCGIGAHLLALLQEEGRQTGRRVGLDVEETSAAQRFCRRLGFTLAEKKDPYLYLVWKPQKAAVA